MADWDKWTDNGYWEIKYPNMMELYYGDGRWKKNGSLMLMSSMEDDYLRNILRELDHSKRQRYFKYPELCREAKRRGLKWKYKIFGCYVGM